MPTLSVDLAFKDYRDIGVVTLDKMNGRISVSAVPLATRSLHGRPTVAALPDTLVALAHEVNAGWIFIDGPQGWKAPDNGLEHARVCERALATQGKTGLPGVTKPGNYVGFITFAIELFDALDERGWPRLLKVPPSRRRCAIESFPTSAWRSLGLVPLPGKGATVPEMVLARIQSLRATFPLDVADYLSHDDLQALVAGLAGVALDDGNVAGLSLLAYRRCVWMALGEKASSSTPPGTSLADARDRTAPMSTAQRSRLPGQGVQAFAIPLNFSEHEY